MQLHATDETDPDGIPVVDDEEDLPELPQESNPNSSATPESRSQNPDRIRRSKQNKIVKLLIGWSEADREFADAAENREAQDRAAE